MATRPAGGRLRSSTGCWTCRLRRKKCDETKPTCDKCNKLQITCDGYAERPFWMDGGYREKRRAEQTKQAIRAKGSAVQQHLADSCERQNSLCGDASVASHSDDLTIEVSSEPHHGALECHDGGAHIQHTTSLRDGLALSACELGAEPFDFPTWQAPTGTPLPFADTADTDFAFVPELLPTEELLSVLCVAPQRPSGVPVSFASQPGFGLIEICDQSIRETQPSLNEANLLFHYFDNMKCLQHPFASPKDDRSWQYVVISKSSLCYYATLSLSAYGLGQGKVDETNFYSKAAKGISEYLSSFNRITPVDLENALHCCFATLQLVFLQILRNRSDLLKTHMTRAFHLLKRVVESEDVSLSAISPKLDSTNTVALRFITRSLNWCNALWCSSLRKAPLLADLPSYISHAFVVDGSARTVACQEWLTTNILEIAELDVWKRETGELGRLSVFELVGRATTIKGNLEECWRIAQRLPECSLADSRCQGYCDQSLQHLEGQITKVFVKAALIYLSVVASGAHRKVPDTARHVREAIQIFESLPSLTILSCVRWPFCLAGCLAEGEERKFFTDLGANLSELGAGAARLTGVFGVMKECWRAVDTGENLDIDWTIAMKNIGSEFILL